MSLRAAAMAVHLFTASGILCALMATFAVANDAWEAAFAWLGLALVIDGIDGTFARMVDVHRRVPRFSGERLDLVVDYVTYVFVPALALLKAGFLPGLAGKVLAGLILISSLYHFSDLESKTEDHCFVGFPAIWNIVAFYFFVFSSPVWLVSAVVLVCVALTFVPMRWLHPMRVVRLRAVTAVMSALWAFGAILAVWQGFPAGWLSKALLLIVAAYGIAIAVLMPMAKPSTGPEHGS